MIFSFKIDKPKDMKSTYVKLKHELESAGGTLAGDESNGRITLMGIEGEYETDVSHIIITITKKPPLIPNRLIENEVRRFFND